MEAAKGLLAILIGAMIFAGQAPAQSFLTNGLVAYYPFNGNANDESGYGNNLTNYGATLCADRFGNSNQAYYFDGSTYLGSSNSPLAQVESWTVTAWIQPGSLSQATAYAVCLGYDNGTNGDGFAMGISGGGGEASNQLWAFFPGVNFDYGGFEFPSTNQWYQVVMAGNAGTTALYVNGVSTKTAIATPAVTPTSLEIGSGGSYRFFTGAVDDVRVYNRALSAAEVLELYAYDQAGLLPYILSGPTNEGVNLGANADFAVDAADSSGPAALSYQWSFDGANISGATNSDLILTNVQLAQQGTYSVTVSNFAGVVGLSNGILTVVASPVIVNQPLNQSVALGEGAAFSVTATGVEPLFYQWEFNGAKISQATNSTLSFTKIQTNQAGLYSVIISNMYGSIASSNAVLVVADPGIIIQPRGFALTPGASATFSVTASGASLNYQWLFNDTPILGQTASSLDVTNANSAKTGQYSVIISNSSGVVTSSSASLSIQSGAAFLEPRAFLSQGDFDPVTNVVIDASTGKMSGGSTFVDVPFTKAGFGTYVFTFSGITLQSNVEVIVTNAGSGAFGIALLSQSDVIIDGVVDASASAGSASVCGPGLGGTGGGGEFVENSGGGGGGGFGGNGGNGGGGSGVPGGNGGAAFNPDITAQLADGSCGGPSGEGLDFSPAVSGGDGGGAIEIAAVGLLTVSGSVLANGANGGDGYAGCGGAVGAGGGGSGGAILVRGNSVTVNSGAVLWATGGNGGAGAGGPPDCSPSAPGGGGGSGGRIVVDYFSAGTNDGLIMVFGGSGGGADGTVFFGQNPMVLPFPDVAISRTAPESIVLSWPATATNYTLQISPSLGLGAVWTAAPQGVQNGENMELIYQPSDVGAFFRLKHN
jgi:uncharacterized protein YjbI with pentapeptide repeats